jgi:hypothetical protein
MGWIMKGIKVDTTTKDNGVVGTDDKVARISVFYFGKI